MSPPSRAVLGEINRRFYRRHGRQFGRTRRGFWEGWKHHLPWVDEVTRKSGLRLFDLGCGNGRYLRFLRDRRPRLRIDSLGVDLSLPLLVGARRSNADASGADPAGSRWCAAEIDSWPIAEEAPSRHDLAVSFALLHHLPEDRGRKRAVELLARRVRPGGVVIVSSWAFDHERFDAKRLTEAEVERRTGLILPSLDPEDAFFGFGEDPRAVRYCRLLGNRDLDRLVTGAGLRLVARPSAREPNRYAVGVRPAE